MWGQGHEGVGAAVRWEAPLAASESKEQVSGPSAGAGRARGGASAAVSGVASANAEALATVAKATAAAAGECDKVDRRLEETRFPPAGVADPPAVDDGNVVDALDLVAESRSCSIDSPELQCRPPGPPLRACTGGRMADHVGGAARATRRPQPASRLSARRSAPPAVVGVADASQRRKSRPSAWLRAAVAADVLELPVMWTFRARPPYAWKSPCHRWLGFLQEQPRPWPSSAATPALWRPALAPHVSRLGSLHLQAQAIRFRTWKVVSALAERHMPSVCVYAYVYDIAFMCPLKCKQPSLRSLHCAPIQMQGPSRRRCSAASRGDLAPPGHCALRTLLLGSTGSQQLGHRWRARLALHLQASLPLVCLLYCSAHMACNCLVLVGLAIASVLAHLSGALATSMSN